MIGALGTSLLKAWLNVVLNELNVKGGENVTTCERKQYYDEYYYYTGHSQGPFEHLHVEATVMFSFIKYNYNR